ncbi:MAG TPA: SDR family NAD(P)-dependent oxidoreductase, partial [Acidimicrobiia bacterium]|nr:SDR family NAD(P)-dependent oxidoreductase [Acidimicrobiia bacterium]
MAQEPTDVPAIADYRRLLDGKVAVVTGGGDGIGGAISRLFAEHGARVEIAEIDPERAAAKQAEIEATGGTARALVVDVRDDDQVA